MSIKYPLLESIDYPDDLRKIALPRLPEVCDELRNFIIETVLANGGHFAANLGVVELTVAIHYVFNTPHDRLVWDVGHQAYGHKILTGRRKNFHTNRKLGGISGFPKIEESEYDAFGTGHSSTAISAILGMAMAAKLDGNHLRNHIAVVGDGALTAGQAFEGLNNMAGSKTNSILIVNDNNIGIDPNTGAINQHLNSIHPDGNLFANLGLPYFGPFDGHNILELVTQLEAIKNGPQPCVVHVKTIKGKGFEEAEKEQTKWHSTSKYIKIEEPFIGNAHPDLRRSQPIKYQDVFGQTLKELADKNLNITGVTPAMPTGSGMLTAMKAYPKRFFDVGIAEQHAVTFAAGMAREGKVVFCSLYSTFMQRAMDQIIHDVCLQNLPVVFCIDRAGNTGDDGPTHHGLYDIALLRCIPNLTMLAPSSGQELRNMMHYYSKNARGPVAIRYPKGTIPELEMDWNQPPESKEPCMIQEINGKSTAILSYGSMLNTCKVAIKNVDKQGVHPSLYDVKIIKPINSKVLHKIFQIYSEIITIEDGSIFGGFGGLMSEFCSTHGYKSKVTIMGFPDKVIEHATVSELFDLYMLNSQSIEDVILKRSS